MHRFLLQLLTEWRRLGLPFEDKTILIAVSGGADSVSLALALDELKNRKKLKLRFVLAHFNHGLRGTEAETDENFVRNLAEKLGLELVLGKGEISKNENLEQSARNARYDFLTRSAENLKAEAVLTAHTLNDQAETFLLNLIRGSGLEGLGAMKICRTLKKDSEILLIRPLLKWAKRHDTEDFCRQNNIEFRFDSMNEDLAFRRVRIRKVLLPLLEDFNPKIIENLAQTAFLLQDDLEFIEHLSEFQNDKTENQFEFTDDSKLSVRELKDVFPSMRKRVLRNWLKKLRPDLRKLDAKHFEAIEALMISEKSGRKVELPDGEAVVKSNGKLVFQKRKVEK